MMHRHGARRKKISGVTIRERRLMPALSVCLVLAASCTPFPELDSQNPAGVQADYPRLVPLDDLLNGPAPRTSVDQIGDMQSRLAALRARSGALQGPVIDAQQRRHMLRGVR